MDCVVPAFLDTSVAVDSEGALVLQPPPEPLFLVFLALEERLYYRRHERPIRAKGILDTLNESVAVASVVGLWEATSLGSKAADGLPL